MKILNIIFPTKNPICIMNILNHYPFSNNAAKKSALGWNSKVDRSNLGLITPLNAWFDIFLQAGKDIVNVHSDSSIISHFDIFRKGIS